MVIDLEEQSLEPMATTVVDVRPDGAAPATPQRVVVVPWGDVDSANGRFVVDAESARRAIEAFEAQGNDLPIDYEHQTLGGRYASPSGQAPAAGWIKRLEVVEGIGLVAHVAWTEPAMAQLAARQYRFLSPVVVIGKEDRRLVALHSAALTNKPAIMGMRPIVNRVETAQASDTNEATEVAREDESMQGAWETLRERLGLTTSADEEAVVVAATERIEALQEQAARREADETVAEAMKTGKLTSAQKDWATALVMRDPEAFASWLDNAPVIVPHGQVPPPENEGSGEVRRSAAVAGARREYRGSGLLQSLTSEEAYLADACREANVA